MPSGLTCEIENGQTFEEFVWRCARAMAVLIHMRDDGLDACIRLPKDDGWYAERLQKARKSLNNLRTMSEAEAQQRADAEYDQAMASAKLFDLERAKKKHGYEAMLHKVKFWEPPTPSHEGLKKLMVEQLEQSIQWDCGGSIKPTKKSGCEWLEAQIEHAESDVSYYAEQHQKEISRAQETRLWIKALDESVPIPDKLRPLK